MSATKSASSSQARRRAKRWAARHGNAIAARMTAGITMAKSNGHLPDIKSKRKTKEHNPRLSPADRRGLTVTHSTWKCHADII